MTVIARWEVSVCSICGRPAAARSRGHNHGEAWDWVTVEVVPADQLQGAVDDLITAAAAFERRFGGYGVAGEVREPLARALDRLQGGSR